MYGNVEIGLGDSPLEGALWKVKKKEKINNKKIICNMISKGKLTENFLLFSIAHTHKHTK